MEIPVLLPKIFNYPLTYNSKFSKPLKPGDLVIVPFGKQIQCLEFVNFEKFLSKLSVTLCSVIQLSFLI